MIDNVFFPKTLSSLIKTTVLSSIEATQLFFAESHGALVDLITLNVKNELISDIIVDDCDINDNGKDNISDDNIIENCVIIVDYYDECKKKLSKSNGQLTKLLTYVNQLSVDILIVDLEPVVFAEFFPIAPYTTVINIFRSVYLCGNILFLLLLLRLILLF